MKKSGFTLAEVLVTLSIIGVVAALTLPQLVSNNTNRVLEVQIKKFYTSLVSGIDRYKVMNDVDTFTDITNYSAQNFVNSVFRVSGECANATANGCFATTYKTQSKDMYHNGQPNISPAVGNNGSAVYKLADGTVFSAGRDGNNINITLDVNGSKGPNIAGKDLWQIQVTPRGVIQDRDPLN